jgi:2-succinyl-5-enolpyruvyl-6-hydroxy-3-cyclohexene-1-carboxylate synthase
VPLLLLTADRPPELRETGANQTIRQPGLFGSFTRWAFDVPVPDAALDPAVILTTAAHAAARMLHPAGPVHLNLPFREPLGAEPDGTDAAALTAHLGRWNDADESMWPPYTNITAYASPGRWEHTGLVSRLAGVERGIVVLGSARNAVGAAADLAARLGWPLLPDVASHARFGALPESAAHYDLALAAPAFAEAHQPDAVIIIGDRPVSKRLLALIDAARPDPYVVVRPGPERFDPNHVVTERVVADPAAFCRALTEALPPVPERSAWTQGWHRASEAAERAAVGEIGRDLSEPFVARTVAQRVPAEGCLVVAASMPVRDVDAFASAGRGDYVQCFANRGASGIDGTVATAYGVAMGTKSTYWPVVLLIGDLALLHDQTSLMLLRSGPPVVVVVVNNDGGGIFHFLPVSRGAHPVDTVAFEAAFGTPHGLTFGHAAAQFGLAYHAPETADAFEVVLAEAVASGQSAVVEVRTDRVTNEALHARITRAAAAAVDATLAAG